MKTFLELSRRQRLFRLRKLAQTALDLYGLGEARLRFIQYFENIIYRLDVPGAGEDRNAFDPYYPGRYLLRIHASGDTDAIASELTWLTALNRDAGIPVPAPVMTMDGRLMAIASIPDIPGGRAVSLMLWLDGRRPRKGMQPKQLHALGQVVAQMHTFAAGWEIPAGFKRPKWNWDALLGGSMFKTPLADVVATIPAKFRQPYTEVAQEAKRVMGALGEGADAFGMIHGDLYPENVLFKGGKAFLIDFEDCGYGHWMMDIAVALCEWAWDKDWVRMRDAFQSGYSQVRSLPDSQWAELDLFIATQFAALVLWSSAMLIKDPKREAEYVPWREKVGTQLLGFFKR